MNLRIVEQSKRTVLAEIRGVDICEIPDKSSEIYVGGVLAYVRQVIKSYERDSGAPAGHCQSSMVWFVVEV